MAAQDPPRFSASEWVDIKPGSLQIAPMMTTAFMLPCKHEPAIQAYNAIVTWMDPTGRFDYEQEFMANEVVLDGRGVGGVVIGWCQCEQSIDRVVSYARVVPLASSVAADRRRGTKRPNASDDEDGKRAAGPSKHGEVLEVAKVERHSTVHPVPPGKVTRFRLASPAELWSLQSVFYMEEEGGLYWAAPKSLPSVYLADQKKGDDDEDDDDEDDDDEDDEEEAGGEEDGGEEGGGEEGGGEKDGEDKAQLARCPWLPPPVDDWGADELLRWVTPRMDVHDDIHDKLGSLVRLPEEDRVSALRQDYCRYVNLAVLRDFRPGTSTNAADAKRVLMKALDAAGLVMAEHYLMGERMEREAWRSAQQEEQYDEIKGRLQAAMPEIEFHLPPSILQAFEVKEKSSRFTPHKPTSASQQQSQTGGSAKSTARPAASKSTAPAPASSAESSKKSGRGGDRKSAVFRASKLGGASAASNLPVNLPAVTTGALQVQQMQGSHDEAMEALRVQHASEKKALETQLKASQKKVKQHEKRYEMDHRAWAATYDKMRGEMGYAQRDIARLEGGNSRNKSHIKIPEAPFKLDSRPFTTGSASARRSAMLAEDDEPEFKYATETTGAAAREVANLMT